MSHNGFFTKILRIYDHNKKVRQSLLRRTWKGRVRL